ncbi:MAG: oligosaccharide flippase family protein [Lachnospiraceae bacterium]
MKNSLIKGTLVLTATSLITRLLGFFYRMMLSNSIGADNVGLYQLCMSIIGIAMAICAGALTTAVSKYVASSNGVESNSYLTGGILMSLTASAFLYIILTNYSVPIAGIMLIGEENASLIRLMAIALPFAAIHGIISGYYYGRQQTAVPAASTLFEQIVRVGSMYLFTVLIPHDGHLNINYAFYSMIAGEITSCTYCVISLSIHKKYKPTVYCLIGKSKELISFSLPLTVNRLLTHVLQSIEAVLIPAKLQFSGLSRTDALAEYGILTGMALPFILLPTIVTNAISVLLLPMISRSAGNGENSRIQEAVSNCLKFCSCLGIFCTGLFFAFGKYVGAIMFSNDAIVNFIEALAFLCPFLFLSGTISSILNGLGYSKATSLYNCTGIIIRLAWIIWGIPALGISAYMYGLLISQLIVCILHYRKLSGIIDKIRINCITYIIKPCVQTVISLGVSYVFTFPFSGIWKYASACALSALIFYLFISKELQTLLHRQ